MRFGFLSGYHFAFGFGKVKHLPCLFKSSGSRHFPPFPPFGGTGVYWSSAWLVFLGEYLCSSLGFLHQETPEQGVFFLGVLAHDAPASCLGNLS
jgi:hypothetical protein